VFWPGFLGVSDYRLDRQRLFQQAGVFSELGLLNFSEVVKILIPFTSNSHPHPLHSAGQPTKEKEIRNVYVK
jgi:hypothetical protein